MWSLQDESEHETGTPEFRMLRGGGIASNEKFDVISIQFAIHYMMQTKQRAQRFFETVSQLLEIGGNLIATTIDARVVIAHLMNLGLDLHFDESRNSTIDQEAIIEVGGGACRIQFEPKVVKRIFQSQADSSTCVDDLFGLEYSFTLVEGSDHAAGVGNAVNLPEWLTPIPALKCLAAEAGLELEYVQNFHEFFAIRNDPNTHTAAHSALYNMKVLNRNGSLSTEEWEISHLYCAVKFRKVSESTMKLDDIVEEAEEEDEIVPLRLKQIDPLVKAKLMPRAMREAKQNIGNEAWLKLSAEEKKHIVDVSIEKLVLECG
jgi:mRNA (guanine-N7-)-methyltransferase